MKGINGWVGQSGWTGRRRRGQVRVGSVIAWLAAASMVPQYCTVYVAVRTQSGGKMGVEN